MKLGAVPPQMTFGTQPGFAIRFLDQHETSVGDVPYIDRLTSQSAQFPVIQRRFPASACFEANRLIRSPGWFDAATSWVSKPIGGLRSGIDQGQDCD